MQPQTQFARRVFLVVFGALAGFCLWALTESWGADLLGPRGFLALLTASAVFFGVALALSGPVSAGHAMAAAAALALPITVLVSWAGLRFDEATQLLKYPHTLSVVAALVLVATPFCQTWLSARARWLEYGALFDAAWAITVRYIAGWLFVASFWLIVFLSNGLLELVGIDIIDALFAEDWLRFAISGAMLGLGLAVAYELRETISPRLPLRLLRLLLPVLLAVVAVFMAALPIRGLSGLFGDFSSAGPLMGVSLAGIALVAIALDRDAAEGVSGRGMVLSARLLALALPFLAGLALWAVWLRVAQYGWTPERVLAAAAAGLTLSYALVYAGWAARGGGWQAGIRRANVWLALGAMALACLWLTPVLNAERISAQSQLARALDGRAGAEDVPLWTLKSEWGRAGRAALSRLAESEISEDLARRIALVEEAPSQSVFLGNEAGIAARREVAELLALMPLRPEGTRALTPAMFENVPGYRLSEWLDGCRRGAAGQPGCVWVSGAFWPGVGAQDQGILLYDKGDRVAAQHVLMRNGRIDPRVRELYDPLADRWASLTRDSIADILAGRYEIVPSGLSALSIGAGRWVPAN